MTLNVGKLMIFLSSVGYELIKWEKKKMLVTSFLPFQTICSTDIFLRVVKPFTRRQHFSLVQIENICRRQIKCFSKQ